MHPKLKMKYAAHGRPTGGPWLAHGRPTGGPWLAHGRPTKKHINKPLCARQVRTGFFYTTLVGRLWAAGLYTSFTFNKYQDILIYNCIMHWVTIHVCCHRA